MLGERATREEIETMYAFRGLDAEYYLWGNSLRGRGQQVRSGFEDIHRGSRGWSGSIFLHLEKTN